MVELLFWFSIAALFYIYVGYPALIWMLARCRPLRYQKHFKDQNLSIVIVGYNEATRLPKKITSILNSHSVESIQEIIVASDGSTDNTAAVIDSISDPRVRLIHFEQRRGKPAVLNDVIPNCHCETIVLTDARQELDPDALKQLAANFADPTVGVVSGELMFREPAGGSTASHGIGVYWKYEKFIRRNEAKFRGVPGATGALYAIRKELFQPISNQTILDDVVIPMQAVTQGYRCIFEPRAIAWDLPSSSTGKESIRKRRTIAGAAQLIANHPAWLLPWRNPIWFEFVSHKLARLVSPLFLLIAAITNLILAAQPLYTILLSLHGCFYLSALAGWSFQKFGTRSKLFSAQLLFLTLNLATVAALWDASRGRFQATWKKTT